MALTHLMALPRPPPPSATARHSDVLFVGNAGDDITSVGATVTCANPAYTTDLLNCAGCTGSYDIPLACTLCSPSSVSSCSVCPQNTFGGAQAEIACQLCQPGYTTIYPPSSISPGDCVPITNSPTQAPTTAPTEVMARRLLIP